MADLWKKRREKMVSAGLANKQRRFSKLDLTAIILEKASAASILQNNLAATLRAIICSGPSKTTCAPLVTGPTNSVKTTLFLPFDEVFGFRRIFRKPALGSKFALRNILRDKRFLFFDVSGQRSTRKRRCPSQHLIIVSFKGSLWKSRCPKPFTMVMWTSSGTEAAS
ncbi:unnamed protein product [Symbiodinium necroappetens]|uniref:Uncharacterized protein n=1 Tax=Symbiodinium necroappetens TaxID=1628268 RepID=A0A812XXW4_9DINO|nr:unnamed protein product [Symbiodinium necroappetens]